MKTFKLNYILIALLCCTTLSGQTKKLDKTFKTNPDVTVNIDARHTRVLVEYWDQNQVQVEATLEMKDADKEEIQEALDNWKVDLRATAGEVKIISSGGTSWKGDVNVNMASIQEPLAKLPEMIGPIQEMVGPLLESISNNPLPPEFYANMGKLQFDYEAYRKDGEKYMEKWEKQIEENFGEDFEKSMEEWAAKMQPDSVHMEKQRIIMEKLGEDFEKDMEAWGEQFGKEMEKWGEQFGKDMQKWALHMEKEVAAQHGGHPNKIVVINGLPSGGNKTIRIKMPREGQLKLNVRHGEVQLEGTTHNLNAQLSHSRFSAHTISGKKTHLKVAYAPVKVSKWNYGVLDASYVDNLTIEKAESIKLQSNSSDVTVNELGQTGIFNGSFGELVINRVQPGFKNLTISLQNSDLELDLPDVAYNLDYNGTRSEVAFPESLNLKSSTSYDNQKLKGYHKSQNAEASISIDANFSEVTLK